MPIENTEGAESPVNQAGHSARPSMTFAMPLAHPYAEGSPPSTQTVTGAQGGGAQGADTPGEATGTHPVAALQHADVRAVAERVYELMKKEIAQSRERGSGGWKG